MALVSSLEEQLQIRTSKLATLEKVLGNTRRHLQDAVENVRETELHYQTKLDEMEHESEEERVELQEKLIKVFHNVAVQACCGKSGLLLQHYIVENCCTFLDQLFLCGI